MRKPRSWLTLGGCFLVQFWCFFVFFFVVFSSLRPERYFIDFYAILSLFSTQFLEFLEQGGSSLFCNPSKQNHDFQGSRASIFQCFFPIFSTFHSGPHFSGFFGDFRVAKAPVLELVGLIFRHQKKESKKGLRVFAARRDATRGGPFKQDKHSSRNSFSTSVHSSGAWGHGGGYCNIWAYVAILEPYIAPLTTL